ncbi:MAG TPA: hypothetical protein VK054_10270, partial [Beutenbergiaceae bacterium]|nr:hypothetical protein [Beutenbergiaceae bacterium]
MRVVFELDDRRDVVAVDRWQPETTLGELINAVMRLDLPDEAVVYVDGTSTQAATRLEQVTLLEGTLISEKPLPAV